MRRCLALVAFALIAGCTPHDIVDAVFGEHAEEAWTVVAGPTSRCPTGESNGDPAARSPGGGNHGLFQINGVHRRDFEAALRRPWSDVYDPVANAAYAFKLSEGGTDWSPWTCRPR